jgi:hypothetical protein
MADLFTYALPDRLDSQGLDSIIHDRMHVTYWTGVGL